MCERILAFLRGAFFFLVCIDVLKIGLGTVCLLSKWMGGEWMFKLFFCWSHCDYGVCWFDCFVRTFHFDFDFY